MPSLAPLLVACALSALGGGAVAGLILANLPARDHLAPELDQGRQAAPPAGAEQERALSSLELRLAELEGTLATLRRQQQAKTQLQAYATKLAQGDADGAAGGANQAPPAVHSEDPVFELAVRSVLDRVEWEKVEEKKLVRSNRQGERAQRQTALLTERLGLDQRQTEALSAALLKQMDRFTALREGDDTSGEARPATRSEWREKMLAISKQTEQELLGILSEAQMKEYRAIEEEEGLGPRWVGRRSAEPAASAEAR